MQYRVIEDALAAMYQAGDEKRGALRARLDFLKRLGVSGLSPGRGVAADYDLDNALRLGLAVELQQFGLGPQVIAKLFEQKWQPRRKQPDKSREWQPERIAEMIERASTEDAVLTITPSFVEARFAGRDEFPAIGYCPSGAVDGLWSFLKRTHANTGERVRLCLFNLSQWLADFDRALKAAQATEQVTGRVPEKRKARG